MNNFGKPYSKQVLKCNYCGNTFWGEMKITFRNNKYKLTCDKCNTYIKFISKKFFKINKKYFKISNNTV